MTVTPSTADALEGVPELTTCQHCGESLKRIDVTVCGTTRSVACWGSCGCEESKWDGSGVAKADRDFIRAGVPERYLKAECDLRGMQREVAELGKSFYIHGPFGSGKTYFACVLVKALVNLGVSARFENSKHLVTEIQGTYSGKCTDALERAYSCKVLVLDDLGKEQPTEYAISMLYEVIDQRYAAGKPMVVTSNFARDELLARLAKSDAATAESIVSRLCDNCEAVFMDGEDRRVA